MASGLINMDGLGSGASQAAPSTSASNPTPLTASTTVEGDVESHLDSFFHNSGWTREDVLVIAALGQLAMWSALLYLEVQ